MLTIAVDAMGGDFAPASEVEGALQAVRELDVNVILVGQTERVQNELDKHRHNRALGREDWDSSRIEIVDAQEVITMSDEVAKAYRRKRNSSIRVAAEVVRDGKAQALVSAGNTGAAMMAATLVIKTLPQVDRAALATVFPNLTGVGCVVLDVGANAECKPKHLLEFAVMGSLYSNVILGVRQPRVGVLSIGEEEEKGNDLTKEAAKLLKNSPLNFIGNVEGRDVFNGQVDVVVCDGFTGNVVLKTSEGLFEFIYTLLKKEFSATLQTKAGALLTRPAMKNFKKRLNYEEFGGVPLLGVRGVTVICHGRSTPKAIYNAIAVARNYCLGDISSKIAAQLAFEEKIGL
jgi:glycerol-3-phosphate acyltransferase PlsX